MKKLVLAAAAFAITLMSCFSEDRNSNPVKSGNGQSNAAVQVALGDGPLPHKLILNLSADGQDTICDTIEVKSNRIARTFFNIAPYKEWKINARTVDKYDSTIHTGTNTFRPLPNQTCDIFMELQARYFSMAAFFAHAEKNMTKAEILIDDRYQFISPITKVKGDTVTVNVDYVPLKSQYRIKAMVYGMHNGAEILLFSGDTIVTLPWYDDHTVAFTLSWKAAHYNQGAPGMIVWLLPVSGNTQAGRIGQPIYFNRTGHYYDVVTLNRDISWNEAKSHAEALSYKGMQGHLAAITSAEENEFIWRYLAAQSGVSALFIGGYQYPKTNVPADNWNWVTGETWGYANWSPGEPNDFNGNDEIWLMMWVYSGKWNDQVTPLRGFIVEYGTPRQQQAVSKLQSFIKEVIYLSPFLRTRM